MLVFFHLIQLELHIYLRIYGMPLTIAKRIDKKKILSANPPIF